MDSNENKENFCGACVAGASSLLAAGVAGSTKIGDQKKNKDTKKKIFYVGVAISIISIFIMIYFLWIKKCNDCA